MNGLGINKAPKNDKDTDILTPDEVALLRTHASDGTLTAEEHELYSKHLDAMKKLIPEKKGKPYGLGIAKILVTVALIPLATITAISLIQAATRTRTWAWFVNLLSYVLVYHQIPQF